MLERPLRPSVNSGLEWSKTEGSGRKEALGTDRVRGEEHQSAWQQQQHEEAMTGCVTLWTWEWVRKRNLDCVPAFWIRTLPGKARER